MIRPIFRDVDDGDPWRMFAVSECFQLNKIYRYTNGFG